MKEAIAVIAFSFLAGITGFTIGSEIAESAWQEEFFEISGLPWDKFLEAKKGCEAQTGGTPCRIYGGFMGTNSAPAIKGQSL